VSYLLTCRHCGSRITTTDRVEDAEAAAIEGHIRADHLDKLPVDRRPDFAEVLAQVRVKMAE